MNSCRKSRSVIWGVLACALFLAGCQHKAQVFSAQPEPLHIRRILVVPFADMSSLEGENLSAREPVCGRMFVAGTVEPDAAAVLTDHLTEWLTANTNYEIVFSEQVDLQILRALPQEGGLGTDRQMLVEAGRQSEADAVLVGCVYRYRERIGGKYSASSPASVAFSLQLIRVADGQGVWQGRYDETQGTLLENMFRLGTFLQRKGQWVSAEEMARNGLDQILANFPKS